MWESSRIRVLGLRFTADKLCPPERFETLEAMFGERGFEAIEIDSTKGNPHGLKRGAHSVLTHELKLEDGHPTKAAFDRVIELFKVQLLAQG